MSKQYLRSSSILAGTLRTVAVVYGRRFSAFALGFFEVLIWVVVVAKVVETLDDNMFYAVAYALGFAAGNFLGITIESHIAVGSQVVRVFTRQGEALAHALRARDYRVTSFEGEGRDGPVTLLFVHSSRKRVKKMLGMARELDPSCFYVIDDVRYASLPLAAATVGLSPTQSNAHWRTVLKRK